MALNAEQLADLELLYKKCVVIWKYRRRTSLSNPIVVELLEHLQNIYHKRNAAALRAFRICINDLCEYITNLSLAERRELNKILIREVGVRLEDIEHKRLNKIRHIVDREKIKSPDEYRMILGRIDEIYDQPTKQKEVDRLNKLLQLYDKTHKPKNE